jgi:hypothetical protein
VLGTGQQSSSSEQQHHGCKRKGQVIEVPQDCLAHIREKELPRSSRDHKERNKSQADEHTADESHGHSIR